MRTELVGRSPELARLLEESQLVERGSSRVVIVEGPAAAGKTALVDEFLTNWPGRVVLRAEGDEDEASIEFSTLDQLLRSRGGPGLPAGSSRPTAAIDIGVQLLGQLPTDALGALVVDDAHWADPGSLLVLNSAVRRLGPRRVLVLLVVREDKASSIPEGLYRRARGPHGAMIRVRPLTVDDIRELAAAQGLHDFSAAAAQRLHHHTAGLALHVCALLDEVPRQEWNQLEQLPASRHYAVAVRRRLTRCDPATRTLVEAAAVLGESCLFGSVARLSAVPEPLAALEEAHRTGLLHLVDPGKDVHFFPPMARAAVYDGLDPVHRARLHLAAADVVDTEVQALAHRAAGTLVADAALAGELNEFARRQAARRSGLDALSMLVDASRLTPDFAERDRRLFLAVQGLLTIGQLNRAGALEERAGDAQGGLHWSVVLGLRALLAGRPTVAEERLMAAWDASETEADHSVRASIAVHLAVHCVAQLAGDEMLEWSRRAVAETAEDERLRTHAVVLLAFALALTGESGQAMDILQRALSAPSDTGLEVLGARGQVRLLLDDIEGGRADLRENARRQLRAGALNHASYSFAWESYGAYLAGAWDEAVDTADRALDISSNGEHPLVRPWARFVLAAVRAARGDEAGALDVLGRGGTPAYGQSILATALARAEIAAARGDPDGMVDAFEVPGRAGLVRCRRDRRASAQRTQVSGWWLWQDRYAEALVLVGRLDDAEELLGAIQPDTGGHSAGSMVAKIARVRGRLLAARGRPEEAVAAFRAGLDALADAAMPFERALLQLAYGQVLRRARKRRLAVPQLRAALETFERLRAEPYRSRCELELATAGSVRTSRPVAEGSQALTPREWSLARLVVAGRTNLEIAAELSLSVKTVEAHLTRIYAKVGVSSRGQLAAVCRPDDG